MKEKNSAPKSCQKRRSVPDGLYIQIEENLNTQWAATRQETSKCGRKAGKQAGCHGDNSL